MTTTPFESTMAEIARDPRARAVLGELGIDDCCAAHLTLAQAAAAAGLPPAELRRRLELAVAGPAPAAVTLDVRGLQPPQPLILALERVETLGPGECLELIHDRRPMLLYPHLERLGLAHETSEPEPGLVRVRITRRNAA